MTSTRWIQLPIILGLASCRMYGAGVVEDDSTKVSNDTWQFETGDTGNINVIPADCQPGTLSDHKGIPMVLLCAGTFTMGSPPEEVGRDDDETQHQVTLTHNFYFTPTEVTQDQFESLMGYNPTLFPECGGDCPEENATWFEAAMFANAVSEQLGLPACYACEGSDADLYCDLAPQWETPYLCPGYRLPTEAEWEYAARAGTESAYFNGGNLLAKDEENCSVLAIQLDNGEWFNDISWYCGNSNEPYRVAALYPNAWGIYDVHGNAIEWTNDWATLRNRFLADYSGDAVDPWGDYELKLQKIVRGFSWHSYPKALRSANRGNVYPDSNEITFRLARTVQQ